MTNLIPCATFSVISRVSSLSCPSHQSTAARRHCQRCPLAGRCFVPGRRIRLFSLATNDCPPPQLQTRGPHVHCCSLRTSRRCWRSTWNLAAEKPSVPAFRSKWRRLKLVDFGELDATVLLQMINDSTILRRACQNDVLVTYGIVIICSSILDLSGSMLIHLSLR